MLLQRVKIVSKGQPKTIGYFVADYANTFDPAKFVSIGLSLCHKLDQAKEFSKAKGVETALERVHEFDKEFKFKNIKLCDHSCDRNSGNCKAKGCIDGTIKDQYFNFIETVMRYYKNDNVIIPKINFYRY